MQLKPNCLLFLEPINEEQLMDVIEMPAIKDRIVTVSLAAERFWWPGMPSEVRNAVKNCQKCIKHEFNSTRELLHPIIATTPLDLVHIDFTSIKVSGDDNLHTTPTVVPVLVITDHFTRHSMAFVTKDQKAITIAKKLYKN